MEPDGVLRVLRGNRVVNTQTLGYCCVVAPGNDKFIELPEPFWGRIFIVPTRIALLNDLHDNSVAGLV